MTSLTPDAFTPPPNTSATGDAMQACARGWRHVQTAVERHARELTGDLDERDDLIQEARVELWRMDASRCDLRSARDLQYLRRALANHMRNVAGLSARRMDDVTPGQGLDCSLDTERRAREAGMTRSEDLD